MAMINTDNRGGMISKVVVFISKLLVVALISFSSMPGYARSTAEWSAESLNKIVTHDKSIAVPMNFFAVFLNSVQTARGAWLLNALKSPQAEILSSAQSGALGIAIIFVQSRDGSSTVHHVEALDTLYFLVDHSVPGENIFRTLVFETDKKLNLLAYRLVDDIWLGTMLFDPSELPDINFHKAYYQVKKVAGKKPIANLSIFKLQETQQFVVSFTLYDDMAGMCDQYFYMIDTHEVMMEASDIKCFFDMYEEAGFSMDE